VVTVFLRWLGQVLRRRVMGQDECCRVVSEGVRREASLLFRRLPVTGGEAAGHDEDPACVSRADGAVAGFDARERVTSAAYEFHCRAAADSAVYGHPGFVPAGFAADRGAAAVVAELCSAGVWEPVAGGYRILDQRAVQRCLDLACELRREETRTRARIREREHWQAARMPEMAEAMVVTPACAACGAPAARVELVAPGQLPAGWEQWPAAVREGVMRGRGPGQWYLIVDGVVAGNGYGSPVDAGEAGRIAQAFRLPPRFGQVSTAGFYDDAGFCADCGVPYCARHRHVSQSGYGHCPLGHGKSLDPHWQPTEGTCGEPVDDDQQQLPPAAAAYPE
jgi:ribosomal protein L37E